MFNKYLVLGASATVAIWKSATATATTATLFRAVATRAACLCAEHATAAATAAPGYFP